MSVAEGDKYEVSVSTRDCYHLQVVKPLFSKIIFLDLQAVGIDEIQWKNSVANS
jgi:hypothetical protein